MKTTTLKNIIVTFTVASSIAAPGFAKPLSDYRSSIAILRSEARGTLTRESESIKTDILSKLKVNITPDLSAFQGTEMLEISESPRLSYADSLRSFMDLVTEHVEYDKNLGKPTNFNPRWSPEESRANKDARIKNICANLVRKSDVLKLLGLFELQALNSKQNGYSNIHDTLKKSSMAPALNFALQSLSKNKDKGVTEILGMAVGFDVVNGVVSEIQMSKSNKRFDDTNTISLTIPMLVSVLTNKDDRFIEAQNCLVEYFQEQQQVLKARQDELTNPSFAARVQKTKDAIAKLWKIYQSPRFDQERARTGLSFGQFFNVNLNRLAKTEVSAAYLSKVSQHQMPEKKDPAAELKEIESRLGMLTNVVPYLKSKLQGATFANKAMAELSKTQKSELLALMLQLRGRDIPTYSDVKALREVFVITSDKEPSAGEIDYSYYKTLQSSLTDLQMHLGAL